ncbi:hypothetical protein MLD38_003080 [Melastoma candidum]|uniref:Uncharacterized protein n=1 Tax=Melastoma candidum TaxID=119954 RepID=A0ACB9S1J7_9MYRT|nr:hypothetical protein MLD38_003080 [Melastoma candidum]
MILSWSSSEPVVVTCKNQAGIHCIHPQFSGGHRTLMLSPFLASFSDLFSGFSQLREVSSASQRRVFSGSDFGE